MEKREETLREALVKNEEERERWEKYKKANESAIENLQEFSKHLTVDVMVPVGRKCLMPGKLIHTNEVLVGHFQDYFSKCTASKAMEICDLRVSKAKEQLKKLETEAELWTNKLNVPYMEGVIPKADEREIIEDFDEEREKQWREEHKKNVRKAKLKEKQQRDEIQRLEEITETEKPEKTDDEILKMLEEAELMEELENELDNLEIDEINDETLKSLMAGDVKLTKPKQRSAHDANETKKKQSFENPVLDGVVKKNTEKFEISKPPATNNNNRPNPEIDMHTSDDAELNDLPQEVQIIKEQAQFLLPNDRVGFYEYQVEIVRKKLNRLKMINEHDVEEKLYLLNVLEELQDLLALAEEYTQDDMDYESELTDDEKVDMLKAEKADELEACTTEKKRIHFALEDDTIVFRREERVSQMLPKSLKKQKKRKRDIIKLDDGDHDDVDKDKNNIEENMSETLKYADVDKKKQIRDKVEKNLQFVSNNQSQVDCDLVSKIIDETHSMNRTIYIAFKHSTQLPEISDSTDFDEVDIKSDFVPGKPSDFYDLYFKQNNEYNTAKMQAQKNVFVNSYIGEEEVKVPILQESNRPALYEDPRSQYSLPKSKREDIENEVKPILRNKSSVEQEAHHPIREDNKKMKSKKKGNNLNEEEVMSAYNKVMNDVVEKPLIEPEPLPDGKFIDAHAPKKRISRFKQARAIEQT